MGPLSLSLFQIILTLHQLIIIISMLHIIPSWNFGKEIDRNCVEVAKFKLPNKDPKQLPISRLQGKGKTELWGHVIGL